MKTITKTSTVSAKGWVVIPQEIRKTLGLKKGDKIKFIDYGGVVALIPVSYNPIEAMSGMLKGESSLTKVLLETRKKDYETGK
jgi:AbrB family looped-hinge helix DNA binding protein